MNGDENGDTENDWKLQVTTSSQPVDNAISKIEELANSLIRTVDFTEEMEENFEQLARNLVELESSRLQLHDDLEIQTINASVIRHGLQTRPPIYQKELEDAVLAARKGNEETMKTLQAKLTYASEEMLKLKQKQEVLQTENAKFVPDRDQVMRQHDEIIASLNQKMADKAGKQIKLNEIRDALRETIQHGSDFELGMSNLQEDMDAFRATSEAEENQLSKDVAETQDAIAIQNAKNNDEKRLNDQLNDRIMDMNSRINVVQKDIRRTENAKTRLEVQNMQMAEKIEREKLMNNQIAEETIILQAEKEKQRLEYEKQLEELEKKYERTQVDVIKVQEEHTVISKKKDEVFLIQESSLQRKAKAQAGVREIAKTVQTTKRKTTNLIEKVAMLSKENIQFQEDMVKLEEDHSATVETYNQQIEEYRTNLHKETTERLKAQEERQDTEKVLDEFRNEQIKFMNDMTKKIEENRMKHKLLTSQSSQYNQEIAKDIVRAETLTTELDLAEKGYDVMVQELNMEIERLKTSIEMYQSENERKLRFIEEKKPVLKELDEDLEDTGKDYNRLKNEVVAVRNKQKSVQEQLSRTRVLLNRLVKPHDKLKEDIQTCSTENMETLKANAKERRLLESEIYDKTRKLENINSQNVRFRFSCGAKKESVIDLTRDIRSHGHYQHFLNKELIALQEKFSKAWDVCVAMEDKAAETDKHILEGIIALQQETKERGNILTGISGHLQQEMQNLTGFLDNVNSRRPIDTRQEKRKSLRSEALRRSSQSKRNSRSRSLAESSSGHLQPTAPSTPSMKKTGSGTFQNQNYTTVRA